MSTGCTMALGKVSIVITEPEKVETPEEPIIEQSEELEE